MSDKEDKEDKVPYGLIAVLLSFPVSLYKWYVVQLYWNNIIAEYYKLIKIDIFMIGAIIYLFSAIKGQSSSNKSGMEIILDVAIGTVILNISYFVFKSIIF